MQTQSAPARRQLSPPRLLVFDWDGTLMDSVAAIAACARAALLDVEAGPGSEAGAAAMPAGELSEAKIRATIGLGLRETVEVLRPGCGEERFADIIERYRHHWFNTYRDLPLLFAGVPDMLAELASRGYLLGIATGKSRRGLDYALGQTGVGCRFLATRTADEAFSKPHPRMLLDVCAAAGVEPGETLMIGDTTFDLEMARNAGTAGVGVLSGSHGRDELAAFSPVACLGNVVELPAWLAGEHGGTAGSGARMAVPAPPAPAAETAAVARLAGSAAAAVGGVGAAITGCRSSSARSGSRDRRPERAAAAGLRPSPRRALARHKQRPT